MDCMEYMRQFPDKHFELAVVDPPYGIGEDGGKSQSRRVRSDKWKNPKKAAYKNGGWDNETASDAFFQELQRLFRHH